MTQHSTHAIFNALMDGTPRTRRQLAQELGLSAPTIAAGLQHIEQAGLLSKVGHDASSGGRRPDKFTINTVQHIIVGVSLRHTTLTCVAIDLSGRIVATQRTPLPYVNEQLTYHRAGTLVNDFIRSLKDSNAAETEQPDSPTVLNVAICVSGAATIDSDGITFTHDEERGSKQVPIALLEDAMRRPVALVGCGEARAMARLVEDGPHDAWYVTLGRHVGGTLVLGGRIHRPRGSVNNEAVGHMTLVPDGKLCECGRQGCANAYCGLAMLPEEGESLPGFFSVLEQGEMHHRQRMNEWMDHFSTVLANLRACVDGDIVIVGEAAQYLDEQDVKQLYERVCARCASSKFSLTLAPEQEGDDVRGAALLVLADILRNPADLLEIKSEQATN
ncbi:ROK family protein [Bifidobacterium dolichotidis]|uniref:ROK family protein n=1 Tax=Bifidobacterium dolichotidis TaxID=2306976 RepID=A0A430FQA9_9BIFI|nr:ROK family protein [Bifidobacterium dolichotidis]RSX54984.1 ROK family protein [Bifidobacterium dolichotidis]